MKKTGNYKNWLMLIYPDEAYEDWYMRIKNTGAEIAYSPLHENDRWRYGDIMVSNPRCGVSGDIRLYNKSLKFKELFEQWQERHKEDFSLYLAENNGVLPEEAIYQEGMPKKPHYHMVLKFSGSKSQEQLDIIARECIAPDPPRPMRCDSIGGSVRYLVHYDDPDKEQFPISAIVTLNGFDIARYFKPTVAQEDELFYSIAKICNHEEIYSFHHLMDWLTVRSVSGDFLEEFRYVRTHCNLIKGYVDSRGRHKRYKELDKIEESRLQQLARIADVIDKKFM